MLCQGLFMCLKAQKESQGVLSCAGERGEREPKHERSRAVRAHEKTAILRQVIHQ